MTPRPTKPRRWTSIAFASVTLAASPAMADIHRPITLAVPGQQLWLAQAQGGEGGEAGVIAEAVPDAAYLTELMIVEGHMLAARDLYALGKADLAVELSNHPAEEGTLDTLRKQIAARKAADVGEAIASFRDAMIKGAPQPEVDAALTAVSQGFSAAAAGEDAKVRVRFDAVVLLLKASADEYGAAVKDGKVEDEMGWHEAWSFLGLARSRMMALATLPLSAKAAPKAFEAMTAADAAFGDATAKEPMAGDVQILLALAARVELLASSVR